MKTKKSHLLRNLTAKEWIMAAFAVAFIVAGVWLDLKMPDYMSEITRFVQTSGSKMSDIWRAGGMMLLCALLSAITSVVVSFFASQISSSFARRLRENLYSTVSGFGATEIKRFSTASLITRCTNDVNQISMVIVFGLQVVVKAPVLAVWAIVKILGKSWQWSLATGIAVAIMLLTFGIITLFVMPKFKTIQKKTDDLNRTARENLNGLRVVHAFNAENYQQNKFDKVNDDLTKTNLYTQKFMAVMSPLMSLVNNGLSVAIYIIGAFLINAAMVPASKLTLFSDMIVFSSYAMQVVFAFMMLTLIFFLLPRAIVSGKRVKEVLSTETSAKDGEFDGNTQEKGTIEFINVGFCYPDASEAVLEGINFKVNKGETVAFIGSTGSGKSTLINLVPRLYDATSGQVLVDGVDVRDYKKQALYSKMGYISQRAVLFTGTIDSNVRLGEVNELKPDTDAAEMATKLAEAKEFIDAREDKMNSEVTQGGTNLSGGQKQRVSIARALARKPEILIFDDSFSALDYQTDKKLRQNLKEQLADTTCLIVAQRIGTIKNADKIIVLDNGKMVGEGTHDELLKNCEVYREIALSQLSKEELASGK